jgi:hypothetical protein
VKNQGSHDLVSVWGTKGLFEGLGALGPKGLEPNYYSKHHAIHVNREHTKLNIRRYHMNTHSLLGLRTAGGKRAAAVLDGTLRPLMQGKYKGSVWEDSQKCMSYLYCQNECTWCGVLSANTCCKDRFENLVVAQHCYSRINSKSLQLQAQVP